MDRANRERAAAVSFSYRDTGLFHSNRVLESFVMSRTSRRYKPLQANNGALPGCNSVRMPRARILVFCLLGVLTLAMVLGLYLSNETSSNRNNRIPVVDLAKDRVRN